MHTLKSYIFMCTERKMYCIRNYSPETLGANIKLSFLTSLENNALPFWKKCQ